MNIGIIGSGVVGTATGQSLSFDNTVTFCDIDMRILKKLQSLGHFVAHDIKYLVRTNEVIFICVNTPTHNDGEQDLQTLTTVMGEVIEGLLESNEKKTIIIRSTILPETSIGIVNTLKNMVDESKWEYFYNPEFLTSDSPLQSTLFATRIVVGGNKKGNWEIIDKLFSWWKCPIIKTSYTEAEMIKYTANCFLATKISFFNEMGNIAKSMGLDTSVIEYAVALDKRIGDYGTKSGSPFSGSCLPKDTSAFQTKYNGKIMKSVLETNNVQ